MEPFDPASYHLLAAEAAAKRAAGDVVGHYVGALHPVGLDASRAELLRLGETWRSLLSEPQLLNIIDLGALTPEMEGLAGCWGLSIPILQAIGRDEIGFAADGAVAPVRAAEDFSAEAAIRRGTGQFWFRNYHHAFFQAGGFVTVDPFTGERLVSTHSFVMERLHIAFRFSGLETFYVIVGGIAGAVRFLGFPRLNCVVLNPVPGENSDHKEWSLGLWRQLMVDTLQNGEKLAQVLATPRRATGVALGSWPNLGHYMWNELAGLEEVLDVHGPGAIQHVLLGPHSHLPVLELFPEIADRPVDSYERHGESFKTALELPYQHIRPFTVLLHSSLRERIYRVAEAHVPVDAQARMAQLARERFLVWVNLRSHNKSWARQVDGHIAVLRKLALEICNLTVILDGWTDTRIAADGIRTGLEPEIDVIDAVGCSLFETFLWARVAHIYSAVVSTGLHFVSHFASLPGVAHANAMHLRQAPFWAMISPGSRSPTFLDPSDVKDEGKLYSNYDFDPDLLYQHLRKLVEEHYPERLVNGGPKKNSGTLRRENAGVSDADLPQPRGIRAAGPAIVVRVADAKRIQGLVRNSRWGNDIAVSDGTAGPRLIEMGFDAPAGAFEIWIELAAADSRPVLLLIDGKVLMSAAAAQITTGWMPADQVWHRQSSVNVTAGTHTIVLQQAEGKFPHVRRLALLPIAAAESAELVQAALEQRITGHAALTTADVDSLVRNVVPVLRNLFAVRRSREAIVSLLTEIATATAADAAAPQDRTGFSGPFNGQRQRQAIFNRLDAAFGFDAMIETGAYLGTTTEMLASLGRPVFSCEVARRYYLRSAVRLADYSNVRLFNQDSRNFLRDLFAEGHEWRMPFFYLDAHWRDDLPLPEELVLISQCQRGFVVFVDDFRHPDPGYGYDRYPSGAEMTLDYLVPRLRTSQPLAFLAPSAPARTETGARRGTSICSTTDFIRYVVIGRANADAGASELGWLSEADQEPTKKRFPDQSLLIQ